MRLISRRARYLLVAGTLALMVLPLMFVKGQYGGSDDAASEAVAATQPGFKPWFEPVWKPPSPEIESLLFAVQSAIGAATIGYVLGRIHGAAKEREAQKKPAPPDVAH